MENTRIPKRLLLWEMDLRGHNWASEVKNLLLDIGKEGNYYNLQLVNLEELKQIWIKKDLELWKSEVVKMPKLRSYVQFKKEYSPEPFIFKVLNRGHRSIIAQFRSGILPLSLETGRYTNIPVQFRLCLLCESNTLEDEEHFLFQCDFYNDVRDEFMTKVNNMYANFNNLSFGEKCQLIMSVDLVKETAAVLYNMYLKRRNKMYN